MIYWLIPYLVAYNASDSGEWKYGAEHVFKAEVRTNLTADNLTQMHSDVDVHVSCRPMNPSLMQCRVESATIENWSVEADGSKSSSEARPPEEFDIGNVVFQVEFNEEGISKLWVLNANGSFRLDMIRAIVGTVHSGIDITEKKYDSYTRTEKSMIGSCETTFDISGQMQSGDEKMETVIDGFSFEVPAFKERSGNEPIVIEKIRQLDRCSTKTLYLFGNSDDSVFDEKHGLKTETDVTSSRSRIYLGRNSFSAYTRNLGTIEFSSSRVKSMRSFMNSDESIRLSLEAVRAAKEELRNTGNLANAGAGFVPGIPWPERNEARVKFYM